MANDIVGLLRLRNQAYLIEDTLAHLAQWCRAIYVWDDASTDGTGDLAMQWLREHKIRGYVYGSDEWLPNQQDVQGVQRMNLWGEAARNEGADNWFLYVDADERLEWYPGVLDDLNTDHYYRMWLFDAYLTSDDFTDQTPDRVQLDGLRRWWGPELREITFMWWGEHCHWPVGACIRQPQCSGVAQVAGVVRHYGKGISVAEWDRKCDYYAEHVPALSKKWKKRKGKAIHDASDFGAPLVEWSNIRMACEDLRMGRRDIDETILEVIHA